MEFKRYLKIPTQSPVINSKLLLLTKGLDFDFPTIRKIYPDLKERYKVNKIRVSDRHFISPKDPERDFIPDELILKEGNQKSVVKVYFKKDSPFLFSIKENKFIILDKQTEEILPIEVTPVPLYNYSKKLYKGVPLDEFVNVVGLDRVSILPFDGCEHWAFGEQCQFCGANPKRLGFTGVKPNVFEIKTKFNGDYKAWWNYYRNYMCENVSKSLESLLQDEIKPHFHLAIMSGNLLDLDFNWEIAFDLIEAIKDKIDFSKIDSYFNLMPPFDFEKIKKVYQYGFKYMCFNLECFDEQIFKKVCPGKHRIYGYKRMIEALKYSVSIFGKGRVRTNFVLGSEPINGLIKGILELAEMGIVSDYTVFFPRPGSLWANKEPPSSDEILYFTKNLVEVYKKYGFKPFCCSLSSRSSIPNEVYEYL
jgi:hypothetical protein